MKVIYNIAEQRKPIKMWLADIEEGALEQAKNLSNLPFLFKHVAIMPDSHQGYGMPIGGVIACKDVVIPNAVGVDIGCGMCAVKTPWTINEITREQLLEIRKEIFETIPVGFNHHKVQQDIELMPFLGTIKAEGINGYGRPTKSELPIAHREFESATYQLGTLGGGNHFIEIQADEDDCIWIMIHSGSRNIGYKIAAHYNKLAIELNKKWHVGIPTNYKLAYLPTDTKEGKMYLTEMQYAVDFALANRKLMMERVKDAFDKVVNWKTIDLSTMINIAHNYAVLENHFGENVWVHRKGATLARKGILGIIPGSQETNSYIVKGLGNPNSFMSCSHGAGRKMSRTEAKKVLNLKDEIKKLDDKGIIHGIKSKKDLDEAGGAYKDINTVMENQKDLVKIIYKLRPLVACKG